MSPAAAARAAVRSAVAEAHRRDWAPVFGSIVRLTGDWMLAEDCTQDAFERALVTWERDGVPRNPGAWLSTAARRRALDVVRRRATERTKLEERGVLDALEASARLGEERDDAEPGDERLRLLFTCCHPALPLESRVALTLKTVAGFTMREVARGLLVSEATASQRILRAKRKIANTGIPYRVPPPSLRRERLGGVLAVVLLIFTEGHTPTGGDAVRDELAVEAIRLARLLVAEYPEEPEARGLLALLLLQHARRRARLGRDGELRTLEEQDRALWDHEAGVEGAALVRTALAETEPGPYVLQAALAAQHTLARTHEETDWALVVHLYDRLLALLPSPVAELGRAVAIGMRDSPAAGLAELDRIGRPPALVGTVALEAARADLLRRAGRGAEALRAYGEAQVLARSAAEKGLFGRRIAEIEATLRT